jgi:hypothetical protein
VSDNYIVLGAEKPKGILVFCHMPVYFPTAQGLLAGPRCMHDSMEVSNS